MKEFKDIEIIKVDMDRSQKTLNVDSRSMRVHYELSEKPPSEWVNIFMANHGRSNLYMRFRATISGKYIVLKMGTDEVSRKIAPDYRPLLDEDVSETNRKYRQLLEKRERNQEARDAQSQREQETARQMLESMKRQDDDSVN